ncbi:unnamed protein product [Leuciscus chuanchicus]
MFHSVSQLPTATVCGDGKTSRRGRSFVYRLKNADQVPQQVCKTFFLATLGYHPANDSLVLSVMGNEIGNEAITRDQRGRHTPSNKLDMQPFYDHIESFHPSVSHYRREHAPHRRYLPSDVNIKLMYADYLGKGNSCSYESYRKAVKHKNISFAKLGEEGCEECILQDQHMKNDHDGDGHDMDCLQCQRWRGHKESAVQSRIIYQADAEKDWPEDTLVKSVDLQKVIMLPRMPGLKPSIFTKRIVEFHETFASVGNKKNKKNTISVVWHEGTAGRRPAEITSAYVTALKKERDICHCIFWVDNCSAQNKNWCLLSSLVCLGHTIMSADSFHHGVELEMKNRPGGVLYDFEDFVSVVTSSNSRKVEVVEMKNEDVLNWKDGHSCVKIKKASKLGKMSVIQLRRGSRSLFFKLNHVDAHFTELDFLRAKFELKVPSLLRPHDQGIEEAKKNDIIRKLCPFMPPNRRAFWCSLPVSEVVEDEE